MRFFLLAAAIMAVTALLSPSCCFADQSSLPASVLINFSDPVSLISAIVDSQVLSKATTSDCDRDASSNDDESADDKSQKASSSDDFSDANSDADEGEHANEGDSAPAEKTDPAQNDKEIASQDDKDGCDQQDAQDADDSDSGDDQQDAAVSPPDDEQRNYRETKVDFYRDTQGYRTATISSHNHLLVDNFVLDLTNDTVAASDAAGSVRSEQTLFSFLGNLNEHLALGGGFGTVYSQGWNLPIGSLKTVINLADATLEAGISRSLLAISADTIRNHVMQTDASVSLSYAFNDNFAPSLEFHHIDYSDHNSSIGVEFTPQYTFHLKASQLQLGYDFNYQSFATNPNAGYWAPQRLIANKLTGAWKFDRGFYFGRIEGSVGPESAHQSDSQPGSPQGGFATSASALLGIRPSENMVFECNFAGDRSPGWNSTEVGFSIKYFF